MNNHSARTRGKSNGRRAANAKTKDAAPPPAEGKRERILDAAVKVFAAEGFYNAKVSQIAQAAGVADGTIYLYFKSKDDLLISLFEDRMERVNANLREALATETDGGRAAARAWCELHLELVEQNRAHGRGHLASSCASRPSSSRSTPTRSSPSSCALIAGAIVDGQKTGELRDGPRSAADRARAVRRARRDRAGVAGQRARSKDASTSPRAAEQLGRPVHRRACGPLMPTTKESTVKILVTAKRVPDPEQKVKFKGNELDQSAANWQLNQFDEYAVETALRLTENAAAGGARSGERSSSCRSAPRRCSSSCARRWRWAPIAAILVEGSDDAARRRDRRAHAAEAGREGEARPRPHGQAGRRLGVERRRAAARRLPRLAAGDLRRTIEVADGGKALLVGREVDAGVEVKKVPLPAVVTVDLRIVAPTRSRTARPPRTTPTPRGRATRRSRASWRRRRSRSRR